MSVVHAIIKTQQRPDADSKPTIPSHISIHCKDLHFDFGGTGSQPVLSSITFDVTRGSRVLLVGANGAGKSTLLRILAGKRLMKSCVYVLGENAFFDAPIVSCTSLLLLWIWVLNIISYRESPISERNGLQTLSYDETSPSTNS